MTLEQIAAAAGVGIGTIYRRFPSVDALVSVVLEEKMGQYADRTEAAAEAAGTDPWPAFRDYVLFILERQAEDLAFSELIIAPGDTSQLFREEIRRTLRASTLLVKRAKEAGVIRSDFDRTDLYLLLQANAGLVRSSRRSAPEAWRRFGQYMLQAFRHAGDDALTPPAEIWTRTQGRLDD